MKTHVLFATMLFSAVFSGAYAQANFTLKEGDKFKYDFSTYGAQGKEVVVAKKDSFDGSVSVQDKTYTMSSPQSTTVYEKATHIAIARSSTAGAAPANVPEKIRYNWFPAGGDFSKVSGGTMGIHHPRCGDGQFKFDATVKPVKVQLSIAGQSKEFDAQEITHQGRWFLGNCGSGPQTTKFTYVPALDLLVERDHRVFEGNGMLSFGSNVKFTAIN